MKIAVIGDVHGFWENKDTEYFNASNYDAIFFVGDLKGRTQKSLLRIIPHLQKLSKPVYFSYGNWDTTNLAQMAGEVFHKKFLVNWGAKKHFQRIQDLQMLLPNFHMGMYNIFQLAKFDLIIGRPFSSGGPISFLPTLKEKFSINNMKDSIAKYKSLIDLSKNPNIVFLSHNGPFGLGSKPTDIYGCDFLKDEYDWGDRDLQKAIKYAESLGKKILFSTSGHMHHRNPKTKAIRNWYEFKNNIHYINSANVPRIRISQDDKSSMHHHVSIDLTNLENIKVTQVWENL